MRGLIAGVALALGLVSAAMAGVPVELRADVAASDGHVTLGDLFDGAGSASGVEVAVRTGPTVVLDAGAVQVLAHRSGLDWANSAGIRRIIVRAGVTGGASATAAGHNVDVLTYARSLATGEIIQPDDLVWAHAAAAPAGAPR